MLRPYQTELVTDIRVSLFRENKRAVCVQLPTGGGKTAVVSDITKTINHNNFTAWFIVPRNELLSQASEHFFKWKIPHGKIASGFQESLAYNIHVVSKDTLIRRYDRIKKNPDIIFIDECHIALDRQIEIANQFPDAKIIGLTATPERTDGRGLSDLYQTLVQGPSIPELTEMGYLSKMRYFAPKISGLENLRRSGTEYNIHDLDEYLNKKRIYGEAIDHYNQYAHKKPALVFCRDVKSAYETAERFNKAGYNFACIEGKMSYSQRKKLLDGLRYGYYDGLTNCDIATYGLDIPRVEVGIQLRPTTSRALYFQKGGRVIRPFEDAVICPHCETKFNFSENIPFGYKHGKLKCHHCKCIFDAVGSGYKKEFALNFDHVNNLYEHAEPDYPDVPPFYAPEIKWNFTGEKKRTVQKTEQDAIIGRLCPDCWMYFKGDKCDNCGSEKIVKKRAELEQVKAELIEATPVKFVDRPPEERKEYVDRINEIKSRDDKCQAVADMLKVADELGNQAMWAYHKLNEGERVSVNVALLTEIAKIKGYKPGWIWMKKKELMR